MSKKETRLAKDKVYNLSEASMKTRDEYGEANTLTSLIYSRFKQVTELYWNRAQLQKLRMLVLQVMRTAPKEHAGNRKLWDDNLNMLEDFQLNHKATAGNLFRKTIKLNVEGGRKLKVTIAPFKYRHAFEKAHPKTAIARVKLYVFSFDILEKTSAGRSVVLLNQPRDKDLTENYEFELTLDDNRLNLILSKVSFQAEPDNRNVNDRQYIGATLLKAIYIRGGEEVQYVAEEEEPPPVKPEAGPGEWEDLG